MEIFTDTENILRAFCLDWMIICFLNVFWQMTEIQGQSISLIKGSFSQQFPKFLS